MHINSILDIQRKQYIKQIDSPIRTQNLPWKIEWENKHSIKFHLPLYYVVMGKF